MCGQAAGIPAQRPGVFGIVTTPLRLQTDEQLDLRPGPEPAPVRGLLRRDPGRVVVPLGDQIVPARPANWGPLPTDDQIPRDRDREKTVHTHADGWNYGWTWTRSSDDPYERGGWRKNLMYGRRMGQAPGTGRRRARRPAVYGDAERQRMEKRHLR